MKHYENSLKQLALTVHGLIFGRAYYREGFCIGGFGRLILGRAYYFFFGGGGAYYRNFGIEKPTIFTTKF